MRAGSAAAAAEGAVQVSAGAERVPECHRAHLTVKLDYSAVSAWCGRARWARAGPSVGTLDSDSGALFFKSHFQVFLPVALAPARPAGRPIRPAAAP